MALKTSPVYRCLEKKTLILGFEILDLFFVFVVLAILNFLCGNLPYKFLFTWGPAVALGAFLKIVKRGKPDNFIAHWIKFQFSPGIYSAFFLAPPRRRFQTKGK